MGESQAGVQVSIKFVENFIGKVKDVLITIVYSAIVNSTIVNKTSLEKFTKSCILRLLAKGHHNSVEH